MNPRTNASSIWKIIREVWPMAVLIISVGLALKIDTIETLNAVNRLSDRLTSYEEFRANQIASRDKQVGRIESSLEVLQEDHKKYGESIASLWTQVFGKKLQ